ncbi:BLOC-1-related complex subunit 8 homolog [Stomoxys calcitrans]|uniref:BLOC-1-related complex subunit 8 homolog n=1 Tax=Stomoxys calcitrans TaxID=35570 RepID=A0A1I8NNG5_STOCA|nr:BLOC-1-related complex subunit 8 homolog [Stomoxys calcitrans]
MSPHNNKYTAPSQNNDLNVKVKKSSEKLSENIHIVANDPSLAFFRIQEHVRKVIQPILDKRIEVIELQKDLQGHCFDMEYAVKSMKDIESSGAIFANIQDMVKNSIFLKQQLRYEEVKNKMDKEPTKSSMYKRFSAHLTLDLDFTDITGVMRETSHRMESIMSSNRENTSSGSVPSTSVGELQRSHTTLH